MKTDSNRGPKRSSIHTKYTQISFFRSKNKSRVLAGAYVVYVAVAPPPERPRADRLRFTLTALSISSARAAEISG